MSWIESRIFYFLFVKSTKCLMSYQAVEALHQRMNRKNSLTHAHAQTNGTCRFQSKYTGKTEGWSKVFKHWWDPTKIHWINVPYRTRIFTTYDWLIVHTDLISILPQRITATIRSMKIQSHIKKVREKKDRWQFHAQVGQHVNNKN